MLPSEWFKKPFKNNKTFIYESTNGINICGCQKNFISCETFVDLINYHRFIIATYMAHIIMSFLVILINSIEHLFNYFNDTIKNKDEHLIIIIKIIIYLLFCFHFFFVFYITIIIMSNEKMLASLDNFYKKIKVSPSDTNVIINKIEYFVLDLFKNERLTSKIIEETSRLYIITIFVIEIVKIWFMILFFESIYGSIGALLSCLILSFLFIILSSIYYLNIISFYLFSYLKYIEKTIEDILITTNGNFDYDILNNIKSSIELIRKKYINKIIKLKNNNTHLINNKNDEYFLNLEKTIDMYKKNEIYDIHLNLNNNNNNKNKIKNKKSYIDYLIKEIKLVGFFKIKNINKDKIYSKFLRNLYENINFILNVNDVIFKHKKFDILNCDNNDEENDNTLILFFSSNLVRILKIYKFEDIRKLTIFISLIIFFIDIISIILIIIILF